MALAKSKSKMIVDVVIPVYNEEAELENNVLRLDQHLAKNFPYTYRIIIANNASTDNSLAIAKELSKRNSHISYIHLYEKGRGRALRKAWMESDANIISYMDVDLSTNLGHFKEIVDAIVLKGYDLGVGSRLMKDSKVERGLKREVLSGGYNSLLRLFFAPRFSDAQCGFKAIRSDAAKKLIPLIKDQKWFFDTELLLLAEREGYRIFETPVFWVERKKSKVRIVSTVSDYLYNIGRMRLRFWLGGRRV